MISKGLQIKFSGTLGKLVEAVRELREVTIEVAAESGQLDDETKGLLDLASQITTGMMPLEVIHIQVQKKIAEE